MFLSHSKGATTDWQPTVCQVIEYEVEKIPLNHIHNIFFPFNYHKRDDKNNKKNMYTKHFFRYLSNNGMKMMKST